MQSKLNTEIKFNKKKPDTMHIDINSCFAVTIAPNVWHTVVARKDNSILLEVKDGPFDPSIAKEYSDWSPSEDSKMANNYLIKLKKII